MTFHLSCHKQNEQRKPVTTTTITATINALIYFPHFLVNKTPSPNFSPPFVSLKLSKFSFLISHSHSAPFPQRKVLVLKCKACCVKNGVYFCFRISNSKLHLGQFLLFFVQFWSQNINNCLWFTSSSIGSGKNKIIRAFADWSVTNVYMNIT